MAKSTKPSKVKQARKNIPRTRSAIVRTLLESYKIAVSIWQIQVDNYFKRVQILMMAIQAALLVGSLTTISKPPVEIYQLIIVAVISIVGLITSRMWHRLIVKSNHFLEFCRRNLRSIEYHLERTGIPLQYFMMESHVFGKSPLSLRKLPAAEMCAENGKGFIRFDGSENETYPVLDSEEDSPHKIEKVTGGLINIDKAIATGTSLVWIITFLSSGLVLIGRMHLYSAICT